jgi:hydrogenase maturation protein HypF
MTGIRRVHIAIHGAVQGVGFRPFIYRLANELQLTGWVLNSPQGVFIEAEGQPETIEQFLLRIEQEQPPRSFIQSLEYTLLDPAGFASFEIRASDPRGEQTALVLPDIATCPDCLADMKDPSNRRYRYPFTNCTNCGPRFTIITSLPYDRPNTSMKEFAMCDQCLEEYENPSNRRFHAQPNACPRCGPHVELWGDAGRVLASSEEAMEKAAAALRDGKILAVKGLGGFHLMVDARNQEAVLRLRKRKEREEKPLAVMAAGIEAVKSMCSVSALEERLLHSPEAPIVLLLKKDPTGSADLHGVAAPAVAPENPYLGVMLPYTPLHHLLTAATGFPLVATSGNITDEPICSDEHEALDRLRGIADLFLVHNRPIVRYVDDSVVRVMMGRELVMRRARGYAPLPVSLSCRLSDTVAVGAHLKNTVAVSNGQNIFISQHIGDLDTPQSLESFQRTLKDLRSLFDVHPTQVAADLHPDYLSTQGAHASGLPVTSVQHHHAHIASCMAENQLEGTVLGVAWDGTGLGPDGTIWGGEFLRSTPTEYHRVASFRTFPLPGGDQAIKEPRRTALGMLYEMMGDAVFEDTTLHPITDFTAIELATLRQMLKRGINAPLTSSAGRLFDAVASIIGLRQTMRFEGQAAMQLEFAIAGIAPTDEYYTLQTFMADPGDDDSRLIIDWAPVITQLLNDHQHGVPVGVISAKFHNTLTEAILRVARQLGEARVVLSGGCFQNKYLTERTVRRLGEEGYRPYWHQRVPTNDGGIALGQLYAAGVRVEGKDSL